jgi:hypothetical protein
LLTNFPTFGGLFIIAAGPLYGLLELVMKKNIRVLLSVLIGVLMLFLCILLLDKLYNYNHIMAFFKASSLLNPEGFQGFSAPVVYIMTRLESVSEIALFLSIGLMAGLVKEILSNPIISYIKDDLKVFSVAAVTVLFAMFLTGAYHTGETARACLFIYPYILLLFYKSENILIKDFIIFAALQTAVMQTAGNYVW